MARDTLPYRGTDPERISTSDLCRAGAGVAVTLFSTFDCLWNSSMPECNFCFGQATVQQHIAIILGEKCPINCDGYFGVRWRSMIQMDMASAPLGRVRRKNYGNRK